MVFFFSSLVAVAQVAGEAPPSEIAANLKTFTAGLKAGITASEMSFEHTGEQGPAYKGKDVSDGYFGDYGGQFIPETLVDALRLVYRTHVCPLLMRWCLRLKGGTTTALYGTQQDFSQ